MKKRISIKLFFLLALSACLGNQSFAANRAEIQAQLKDVRLGKILHENNFRNEADLKGWVYRIGKWTASNGELHGEEIPAQKHHAAARWKKQFKDVVVYAEFKLGNAKSIQYRFDAGKGHLGGFTIDPTRNLAIINLQNYTRSAKTPPKWLANASHKIQRDKWYPVILQSVGETWKVYFDEKIYEGTDQACAMEKNTFGFIVVGQGATFRNLSIWQASSAKRKPNN